MILKCFFLAHKRLSTKTNGVHETPLVANQAYKLHDVKALRVAVHEDDELDRHLEIGMLVV